jgi:hypothetical protein
MGQGRHEQGRLRRGRKWHRGLQDRPLRREVCTSGKSQTSNRMQATHKLPFSSPRKVDSDSWTSLENGTLCLLPTGNQSDNRNASCTRVMRRTRLLLEDLPSSFLKVFELV